MELYNPFTFLSYSFGVNALISALLTGFLCSAIGTFVVLKKMPFIGAGLAHIAFAGVALGILTGKSPLLSALLFTVTSSIILWYLSEKRQIHYDVTVGVLFSASMGLAVVFLSLSQNFGSEALSYLFGSPLLTTKTDILLLLLLSLIVSAFFIYYWREIYLILFSEEIAKASGYRVHFITFWLFFLTAFAVTLSIESVGALLVFSLLIVPPATAHRMARTYNQFFILSVILGVLSAVTGMLISFTINAPPGATITLISTTLFGLTTLFK
ncbi:zinc transport system permease protein [Desulfurobacterium pacificum]|uniref:Zinc transport system permease protein n=1 Tax=Desulfurobacterium pacificum TaxID=240166 RepID=A0ABY1NDQ8_9BACT|nr:metal ABC transporter permease [Desulfurobacterium pacificum]SMP07123.1 zinc transport system permease protein [Desulfurobacterium pacificum]